MKRGWEYFARSVPSVEELPEGVRGALADLPPERIRLLVIIPPQEFPVARSRWLSGIWMDWRWTPHRTLAFCDDAVVLVEGAQAESIQVVRIPLTALLELRLTTVLLYAALEIVWQVGGAVERRRMEFNAVGRLILEKGLALARTALSAQCLYPPLPEDRAVPFRERFPLKFTNMTRVSLLPGERVQWALHTPPLRRTGARRWQALAPGRAVVLTPQTLIVIEEGKPGLFESYRIDQRFFPRGQVRCVRRDEQPEAVAITVECAAISMPHTLQLALAPPDADELHAALTGWIAAPFAVVVEGAEGLPARRESQ